MAIGTDSQATVASEGSKVYQAKGDIRLGNDIRDEQYEIALNWDGKTIMRKFNLANRDLSNSVLTGADLQEANLDNANLEDADLRGDNLNNAVYNEDTSWPTNFDPVALCTTGR